MPSAMSTALRNLVLFCMLVAALIAGVPGKAFAAPNFQVARTSGSDFFIDLAKTPYVTCQYASYLVTNNDGVTHPDVWVRISGFGASPKVKLNDPTANTYQIGPMNNGDAKPAFFYLAGPSSLPAHTNLPININESHTVELFDGDPNNGGTPMTVTGTFTLGYLQDMANASANKINGGSVVPQPTVSLGQDITITVNGTTGTAGAGPGGTTPANSCIFSPAVFPEWPAKAFKIVSASVTLSNGQTGTFNNALFLQLASPSSCDYVVTYTVRAVNTTSGPTSVAPLNFITSGQLMKHTDLGSIATITPTPKPTIPTVTNGAVLTGSVNPTTQAPGGPLAYTINCSDTGPQAITLNFFQSTLAAGFAYVPGSSKYNGNAIPDPTNNANVLKWAGPFGINSGSNGVLTFSVTATNTTGTYALSASTISQLSSPVVQIDSTADTNDNAPLNTSVQIQNLPPPSITSIAPDPARIGQQVTITGTGFTGVNQVTFTDGGNNPIPAAAFTVVSATQITATVPAGAVTGNVTVKNFVGQSSKSLGILQPPNIALLTPNHGLVNDTIVITGTNFTGATIVSFGQVHASFTFNTDTQITCTVPAGAGPFVMVTGPGGDSNQAPFTVDGAPSIDANGLNPTTGVPGTAVTITGSGFTGADQAGGGVKIGNVNFTNFTVNNDGNITGTIPAGAVTGGVVVYTTNGASNAITFTVPPPQITSFTPNVGLPGDTVHLVGQFFTGVTGVTLGGNVVTFNFIDDGHVDFTVPANIGNGQIVLTTPAGNAPTGTFSFPVPTITGFNGTVGVAGTVVTLTGTNFLQASQVTFGGIAATQYTVAPDGLSITVTVPQGAASGLITVTAPGGTADTTNCAPPTYTILGTPSNITFLPIEGLAGTTVVISGNNFTGATAVKFNGIDAQSYTLDSDTQITASAPGGNSTGKVSVTNPAGTGTSAADWTLRFSPTISSFSPTSGPGGTTVVIVGQYFTGATVVKIGGVNAASYTVDSDNQISAVVANNASSGLVEVTTQFGTADSSACPVTEFTLIPVPSVTGLNPNHGVHGTSVVITGSGFTNATAVKFGLLNAQSYVVNSDTQITAVAPDNVITADVTVTTAGGTSGPGQTFTLDPPDITDFNPKVGLSGTVVVITGSGFTDATAVKFNGQAAGNFTVNSDTQITATAPNNVTAGKISVTTLGGTATSVVDFTLPVPQITAFAPTAGIVGSTVTLTGLNFDQASKVTFGGVPATQFTVAPDGKSITVTVPVGAASGPIEVTCPGGVADTTQLNPGQFHVIGTPTITNFTPNTGYAGITVVVITGTDFLNASGVKFNGVSATNFTVNSDTQITVTCPVGAGTGPLSVVGVGGTGVSVGVFTVIGAPTITDFSPKSGPAGTTVTLTGKNFTGTTGITIGGVPVTQFTVNNDGSITLVVPTNGLTGKIVVTTPAGSGSTAVDFKIPPTITSFSPQTGGPGTTVIIKGLNFTGTTGVTIGGVPVTSFVVNDDGTITAVVGAGGLSGTIVVTTGGGSSTSNIPFVVAGPPQITSFDPTHGKAGAVVTVIGKNFTGVTTVNIGGTAVTSFTVINDTTISLVAGSGTTGKISATNSYGTGTSAGTFTFDVTTAAVVGSNNASYTASAGGTVTLNSFQVTNTGTTIQTLFAVTIAVDNPSMFTSGTLTATAASGTVSATVSPISATNVFTFPNQLLLQPGESANITLKMVAAPKAAGFVPLLALIPLLGMLSRRTRKAAMMLALACVFTVGLTGCGGGGGSSVGGVSSSNGSYQVGGNPAAANPAVNIQVTQIVGKGPDGQSVNYPNLPVNLGQVTVTN